MLGAGPRGSEDRLVRAELPHAPTFLRREATASYRAVHSEVHPAPIAAGTTSNLVATHTTGLVGRTANRCPTPLPRRPAPWPRSRVIRTGSRPAGNNRPRAGPDAENCAVGARSASRCPRTHAATGPELGAVRRLAPLRQSC